MAPSLASHRASKRFSTYSGTPSEAASMDSSSSTGAAGTTANTSSSSATATAHADPRLRDINALSRGLERLSSSRLQQQRYQPTPEKSESLSKLALGAKLERALGRRMTSQDAVLRPKPVSSMDEKQGERPAVMTRRTIV